MFKRSSMYGIAALIVAACIFSACPTESSDPEETTTPDTTAPVLQSIEANGFLVVLSYNEALKTDSVPDKTDFTFGNFSGSIDNVKVAGSKVTLTLVASAASTDTNITLTYTPDTNPIKAAVGNAAAALAGKDVTNGTLVAPAYNGTPGDGQFKTVSADATNDSGATKLTFTYQSNVGYVLQYALTADGGTVDVDTAWTTVVSDTAVDDIMVTANDDDLYVRFIDASGQHVSAPVEDTNVILSVKA
jgi:hypothetical protein